MLRGLFSGLIWGLVLSALGLAVISLAMGPPIPRAIAPDPVDVAVPAGSEFNRNRPEAPPVIPGSEETGSAGDAPLVTEAETEPAPLADTTSADVPQSDSVAPEVAEAPDTDSDTLLFSDGDSQISEQDANATPEIVVPDESDEQIPEAPDMPVLTLDNDAAIAEEPDQPTASDQSADSPVVQLGAETTDESGEEPILLVLPEGDSAPSTETEQSVANTDMASTTDTASEGDTGGLVLLLPETDEPSESDQDEAPTAAGDDMAPDSDGAIVLNLGTGDDDVSDIQNTENEETEAAEPEAPATANIDTSWMRDNPTNALETPSVSQEAADGGELTLVAPEDEGTELALAVPTEADDDNEPQPAETVTQVPLTVQPSGETGSLTLGGGDEGGVTIRLPTIGDGAEPEPQAQEEAEADNGVAIVLPDDNAIGLGALARNSVPYTRPDGTPLLAIILIDVGEEGLDRNGLMTFSFPVAIAIDPTDEAALNAAKEYRDAGLEVLVKSPPIPEGIDPRDVGDVISAYVSAVPEAIGLVDAAQGGFQSNRRMVGSAVEALLEGGHGLLTYDRGLNTAQQVASAEGLPSGTIFRVLDAEREDSATIKRYLDRAAFRAGQDGHAIMIGHSYPETVTAIFTWMIDNVGRNNIAMAPVSALIRN